jgi:hypothetical protein
MSRPKWRVKWPWSQNDGSEVAHRQGDIEVLRDVIEGGAELALRQTLARSSRRPTDGDEVPAEVDGQDVAERSGAEPAPGGLRSRGQSRRGSA